MAKEASEISAVFCLQEPGEHPFCGDKIHKSSGLSYRPEEFYLHGIGFYNFGWRDHETTDINTLIKIVKTMDYVLSDGKKLAVHCHAGKGRTALVICAYLIFRYRYSSEKTVELFRSHRVNSLKKGDQVQTLKDFEKYIEAHNKNYFAGKRFIDIVDSEKLISPYEKTSKKKFFVCTLIECFFERMYQFAKVFTSNELTKAFYEVAQPERLEERLINAKLFSQDSSVIEERFREIESPTLLCQMFLDFLEDLQLPYVNDRLIENILFFMRSDHSVPRHQSIDTHFIVGEKICEEEMVLFFEISKFHAKMGDCSIENFNFSLFRIIVALLKLKAEFAHFFDGRNLRDYNFEATENTKILFDFFTFLRSSAKGTWLLKNSIEIINSPLRKFSALTSAKPSLFSQGSEDSSLRISQVITDFKNLSIQHRESFLNEANTWHTVKRSD